ncbi:MAG TPA: hypothetical protein VM166_09120 [Gemmatimonadaceae bacterium]|nr:hypothetical protein [Gemmatimonadaceae bacterium]
MIRKLLAPVLVFTIALFSSCKKEEPVVTETSTTATDTSTPADATTRSPRLATSPVKITFRGMVAHVFGDSIGERDRAVVLEDGDHPVYLSVPEQVDSTRLAAVTGLTPQGPSGGYYLVGPISGFAVRVVGLNPADNSFASVLSKPLVKGTTFDTLAPHLTTVTEGELDQTKLKTSLFDPVPDKSDWAMIVALDGGTLSATKACKPSTFDNETTPRDFAAAVTLTGDVEGSPAIQFLKKGGQWETVTFNTAPKGTTLAVAAVYKTVPSGSHFKMFKRLGAVTKFHDIKFVACDMQGLDPACTNSQWP